MAALTLPRRPTSYDELRLRVTEEGGVFGTTAQVLRDIEGAGRLGSTVRAEISQNLAGFGLRHLPAELPQYQEQEVIVYLASGPVAAVINAVLNPSISTVKVLRQLADNNAQETLDKIRRLVGPPTE
jgi:hypothetical protein